MQWSDRFGKVLKNDKKDVKWRLKVSKNTQILFKAFFPCHDKCRICLPDKSGIYRIHDTKTLFFCDFKNISLLLDRSDHAGAFFAFKLQIS